MLVLHINSENEAIKIDEFVRKGHDVFILVYMEGCGPCNATRPEWHKVESALKEQYAKNTNLVIVDINKNFLSNIKHIGNIDGFPTMKYIGNYGKTIETYEDSSIKQKDRSVNSFINWIESKITNSISTTPTSSSQDVYDRLTMLETNKTKGHKTKGHKTNRRKTNRRKTKGHKTKSRKTKGGKWSRKYKLSINCENPKGFSQNQYCKYGRNK